MQTTKPCVARWILFLTILLLLFSYDEMAGAVPTAIGQDCDGGELKGEVYKPDVDYTASAVFVFNQFLYAAGSDLRRIGIEPNNGTIPSGDDVISDENLVTTGLFVDTASVYALSRKVEMSTVEMSLFDLEELRARGKVTASGDRFADIFVQASAEQTYAYLANGADGLLVVNVTNPDSPVVSLRLPIPNDHKAVAVFVKDNMAYVAATRNSGNGRDIWLIDVSNPTVPELGEGYNVSDTDVQELFVTDEHILLAAGSSGLLVLSRADPSRVVGVVGEDVFGDDVIAQAVYAPANDYAYVALGDRGVVKVSLQNPREPTVMGCYDTDGEAKDVFASGDYVYVADDTAGVAVVKFDGEQPPTCHTLTLTHAGEGENPEASPQKSSECDNSGEFQAGATVSLTALPADNWQVANWHGTENDASTDIQNTLVMPNSDHTVEVAYKLISNEAALEAYLPIVTRPVRLPQLNNGGFELQDLANVVWQESIDGQPANTDTRLIVTSSDVLNWSAHTGDGLAWLGGFNDAAVVSEISQIVQVESYADAGISFEFWYAIGSNETDCNTDPDNGVGDVAELIVDGNKVWSEPLCIETVEDWTFKKTDLGEVLASDSGRPVPVIFRVTQDNSQNSNFFLDDVRFCTDSTAGEGDSCSQ